MKKYIFLILIWLLVIFAGFIKISSELPDFIKDKSSIKVTYNSKPFNLKFETSKYIIYLNDQAFTNIKNNIVNTFNYFYKKIIYGKNHITDKIRSFLLISNIIFVDTSTSTYGIIYFI